MSEPFLAEIRMISFNWAPKGWAVCDGALMRIDQNQALFSLVGTTFGGDGRVNFRLPDLQGRVPVHVGNGHTLGETGGEDSHTLTANEMPQHLHTHMASSTNADRALPSVLAAANKIYGAPANLTPLGPTVLPAGGSQPHVNLMPYLTIAFVIAIQGIFPSRN